MKILYVVREIALTGVLTHVRDLSEEMIKKGHAVVLLTGGKKKTESDLALNQLYDSISNLGVRIVKLNFPLSNTSKLQYALKLFISTFQAYFFLKKNKFDVIHLHTPVLSYLFKLFSFDFIMTRHLGNMRIGAFYQNPNYEIAISQATYNDAIKAGMNPSNVFLIHNGVNSRFSQSLSDDAKRLFCKMKNISKDRFIIGFVGTLCPRKGLDILLNACDKLNKTFPGKIELILLGNSHLEKEKVWFDNLLSAYNNPSYLKVFSYEDPKPFYDIFDVLVLPSRREGFPLVVLEAMLSGCCVVRSNTEGAYEQIIHEKDGMLFNNEDASELACVLQRLMNDLSFTKHLAQEGREKAMENFTSAVMAMKTLDVYEKMIVK